MIRLNEYKGRAADMGKRTSNADIATGTGINLRTVERISSGDLKEIRGEYIDAISTYFAQLFGVDVGEINLVKAEAVHLPLALNIGQIGGGREWGSGRGGKFSERIVFH
jgi:hypothetical protein